MHLGTLLIRADASIPMGTGHVMRCLALAQAWQDAGGRAVFAMAEATDAIQARLSSESCDVATISAAAGSLADAGQTINLARQQKCDWIVVDGYAFSPDYQRALHAAGFKILFLDDYGHAQHYFADLVLNQNVSAKADSYVHREPHARLLLGPEYCLLRREFAGWRDWRREISPVCRRLLVMMGGSDPENITARVMEALRSDGLRELETTVVVGGSNPNCAMLRSLAAQEGRITVRRDVTNMAELMAAADVAISASGSTGWELCLLGLPSLLVDVADNQKSVAKELDRRGCAIHLGDRTVRVEKIADQLKRIVASPELRQCLSRQSRQLVDGRGAMRVVSLLRGRESMRLRPVGPDDMRLLWEWANDPEVRAASFSPAPIPWETHVAWLTNKLQSMTENSGTLMMIAEDERAAPLGEIRFDARPDREWEVDVSLSKPMRGRGMASQLIRLGVEEVLKKTNSARIHAFVRPSNLASVKAFERADFKQTGTGQVRGHTAIHLVYERD